MANDFAIKLKNVSKVYRIYDHPIDRLKESLHPFHKRYSRDFYALENISFSVAKGETVGFIGRNGAGKSTLLKLITGVLTPTTGEIEVRGRVASLLELGAGFNPEMTGIENIYMSGTLMGRSEKEMDSCIDAVIDFADIGDFINQPVKMYSSGMFARVAFAVNAFVEPDILIVDEALSVGDAFFQAKCIDKMKQMMDSGVTVLFVSHDTNVIRNLCQKAVFLEKGRIVSYGSADKIVEDYFKAKVRAEQNEILDTMNSEQSLLDICGFGDNAIFLRNAEYQRIQNGAADFYNIQLLDKYGNVLEQVEYGQNVCLRISFLVHKDIPILGFAYHIRSADGVEVVYSDTKLDEKPIFSAEKNKKYVLEWDFIVTLKAGQYNIACGMSIPYDLTIGKVEFCDFVPCAVQFSVVTLPDAHVYGYVHWKNAVEILQYDENKNCLERVMEK